MTKNKLNHNAARDAGRSIRVSAPRMVRMWKMFTVDGKPVYCFGASFTLEKSPAKSPAFKRSQATRYEDDSSHERRLARAGTVLGAGVEWREAGSVEMMGVSL